MSIHTAELFAANERGTPSTSEGRFVATPAPIHVERAGSVNSLRDQLLKTRQADGDEQNEPREDLLDVALSTG